MSSIEDVLGVLGGQKMLGKRAAKARQAGWVMELMEKGFPFGTIELASQSIGIDRSRLLTLIGLPLRTYARRKKEGRLGVFESDRLYRLARIYAETVSILGSSEKARRWLQKVNQSLGGQIPLDMIRTDVGTREVEKVLGKIHHGVFG